MSSPAGTVSTADRAAALAGQDDDSSPGDNVLKLIQRFALKSLAWLAIYWIGYFDFSFAWLITPLVLTVLRDQWKKERDYRLSAARHAAIANEKEMIESRIRVEDLPSWVFFPDKERAEWINSILQQLWPNVGHYTRKIIAETVEPAVKAALDGYGLAGFKFEKVVLGQIPPRVTGIKVYDKNVGRDEIILDLDIIHASDCDIKFSLKRLKAKITDFSLRGMIRVVLKPLITDIPLIGGVQVYFLTSPEIDFDLGGIANALDAPGLSNIIRKIILEQIGNFIVLPNKFTLSLSDSVTNKQLKCPDSAGILRVNLVRAEKLMRKDIGVLGMGKSDPYAILRVGAKRVETPMIKNTINPEWNFIADFPIEVVKGQTLHLELMDHDDPGDDEFLGRATVQTGVVASKGQITDMWVELEDVTSGKVLLDLSWLEATTDKSHLDTWTTRDEQKLAKCILHVYIDSCKGLELANKKSNSKPSPVVELTVAGQDSQQTWPQYHDADPVFEQGFVFLVFNPNSDDLHIKVLDSGHKNSIIGSIVIRMSDLFNQPNLELASQPFPLNGGGPHATIHLAANLRCLKKPKPKLIELSKSISADVVDDTQKKVVEISSKSDDSPPSEVSQSVSATSNEIPASSEQTKMRSPSLDEMVANTLEPMVKTTGNNIEMSDIFNPLMELRHRAAAMGPCGKIKVGLVFDAKREELKVTIYEAKGLPGGDLPDPPDPYVKLYLLPDRSKKSKKKSDAKKDTVEPVFNEVFTYSNISAFTLESQQLEVSVVDRKGIFSRRSLMGKVVIKLSDRQLTQGSTNWYQLEEAEEHSD